MGYRPKVTQLVGFASGWVRAVRRCEQVAKSQARKRITLWFVPAVAAASPPPNQYIGSGDEDIAATVAAFSHRLVSPGMESPPPRIRSPLAPLGERGWG